MKAIKALEKQQRKWLNYLASEKQRQNGSVLKHSQFPEFMLSCEDLCNVAMFKTSDPDHATQFLRDHLGHRVVFGINQRPDARIYDRDLVLDQVKLLGQYVVSTYSENHVVVTSTRQTWLAIKNGIDIEGALKRLGLIYKSQDFSGTAQTWVTAILDQDQKFLAYIEGDL